MEKGFNFSAELDAAISHQENASREQLRRGLSRLHTRCPNAARRISSFIFASSPRKHLAPLHDFAFAPNNTIAPKQKGHGSGLTRRDLGDGTCFQLREWRTRILRRPICNCHIFAALLFCRAKAYETFKLVLEKGLKATRPSFANETWRRDSRRGNPAKGHRLRNP